MSKAAQPIISFRAAGNTAAAAGVIAAAIAAGRAADGAADGAAGGADRLPTVVTEPAVRTAR